jgi:hypothetical protein
MPNCCRVQKRYELVVNPAGAPHFLARAFALGAAILPGHGQQQPECGGPAGAARLGAAILPGHTQGAVVGVLLRVSQSTFIWVNPDPTTLLYNGMEMYRYDLGKALRRLC